jgi:hypothetical protein
VPGEPAAERNAVEPIAAAKLARPQIPMTFAAVSKDGPPKARFRAKKKNKIPNPIKPRGKRHHRADRSISCKRREPTARAIGIQSISKKAIG